MLSDWTPIGAAALIAGAMGLGKDTVLNESVIWISDRETDVDTSFKNSILLVETAGMLCKPRWFHPCYEVVRDPAAAPDRHLC